MPKKLWLKLTKWQKRVLLAVPITGGLFVAVLTAFFTLVIYIPSQMNVIHIPQKAEEGNVVAQRVLGYRYSTGGTDGNALLDFPKDNKKALYWSGRAARAGNIEAYFDYAQALEKDGRMQQAIPWYIKAAREGNLEAARILKSPQAKTK